MQATTDNPEVQQLDQGQLDQEEEAHLKALEAHTSDADPAWSAMSAEDKAMAEVQADKSGKSNFDGDMDVHDADFAKNQGAQKELFSMSDAVHPSSSCTYS